MYADYLIFTNFLPYLTLVQIGTGSINYYYVLAEYNLTMFEVTGGATMLETPELKHCIMKMNWSKRNTT